MLNLAQQLTRIAKSANRGVSFVGQPDKVDGMVKRTAALIVSARRMFTKELSVKLPTDSGKLPTALTTPMRRVALSLVSMHDEITSAVKIAKDDVAMRKDHLKRVVTWAGKAVKAAR